MAITEMSHFAEKISKFSRERLALLCAEMKARLERVESAEPEPIAIVGMGCRFPGGATDLDSFWELLHNGVDAVTEIPLDRWDVEAFYDRNPDALGKMYCRHGGFVRDVDRFDPYFFNISPREAASLDPQYRLLLEVTWQALENAGQNPQELRGTRTGVFIGVGTDDYAKIQLRNSDPESITAYTGTGNAYCYGVGRLSYFLGLHGPNFPVDTACSSSLVVTHLACHSLRSRESDVALAGGVHLMLSPVGSIFLSKARALSPDGRCKTFDALADGFVRGEGCGVIVLKRLSDAISNRDRIHALIRGSAINHDGPSSGFTVPHGPAQQAVIEAALKNARVEPTEIDYVEAHGTGTSLGDPIEIRGVAATLGRNAGRSAGNPLVIGSVKTNFGHLESAAGVAGLIKTVLAFQHEEIPPHLHLKEINPHIPMDDGPFVIPTRPMPWLRSSRPRLAGVSSFGLSGTNAHVILQEPPVLHKPTDSYQRPVHVLTLSARTESALKVLAARFEGHLASKARSIADICFTANTGRARFSHRLAVVTSSAAQLGDELKAFSQSRTSSALISGKVESGKQLKVAFLFSGEGCQYFGMGGQLYVGEPRFREAFQQCEEILGSALGQPLSKVLYADSGGARILRQPVYSHAALFALAYGLVQLWRAWGINPSAVLGHGLGEYVAASTAGVLTVEDALSLVVERARLAQSLPGDWRTAAVLDEEKRVRKIAQGEFSEVAVVAVNSPRNVVVGGPRQALGEFIKRLKVDGIKSHLIPSDCLYSTAALPILDRLEEKATEVGFRPPQLPIVSTLTGDFVRAEMAQAGHWRQHASQPIRFAAAIEGLHRKGYDTFLEIGPKSLLTSWGKQCLPHAGRWQTSVSAGKEWSQMLSSLSRLYIQGRSIDWSGFDRPYSRERVPLPTYPFERQRYWLEMARPVQSPVLIAEEDALQDPSLRSTIERLVRTSGDDGSQAVNRRVTAPLIFLSSSGQSFFYLNQQASSMVIQTFVGSTESFEPATRELLEYARTRDLNLIIFAPEGRADRLRKLGFTTTPVGVWQSIADMSSFSIHSAGMRRLRSKANSYSNRGSASTDEYVVGSDAGTDRHMVDLMDTWVARKKRKAPFVSMLREEILNVRLDPKYRIFLTRRAGEIESVILLAPIESKNGYLLDLEFYPAQMPSGCLEFSIVNTIEQLKKEGITYYSLGSTFGTRLDSDPHEDARVRDLLQSFHREGILNDDGIFEFKKKFQPDTLRLYICCLPETDISALPDMLLMLAAPEKILRSINAINATAAVASESLSGSFDFGSALPSASKEQAAAPVIHPLLGRRIPLASADVVFESRLDLADREWSWLADHRVLDHPVLPAAAYIEMARAASVALFRSDQHVLEGLSLMEALPLSEGGPRIVQLIFSSEGGGVGTFRVWSKRGEPGLSDADWILHATGRVKPATNRSSGAGRRRAISLTEAEKRLQVTEPASYYHQVEQFGLKYGERFRAIHQLWSGYGEALASIQLNTRQLPEVDKYYIHPVLLDACLQVQGAALFASQGESVVPLIYLPVSIERIHYHRRPGPSIRVHCRLRPVEGQDPQQIVGDIQVLDDSGSLLVAVDGLAVKRTGREVLQQLLKGRSEKVFYQVEWRPQHREIEKPRAVEEQGSWVLFADAAGTAARLAELLREKGEDYVMVYPEDNEAFETGAPNSWRINPAEPEPFQHFLKKVGPVRRVIYLWAAAPQAPEDLDLDSLRRAQKFGCQGLLHLLQALAAIGSTGSRQLWVVTRGTQPVGTSLGTMNPAQAPVWGLGRTVAQEHPEFWGGMIDLEAHASPLDPELLLEEILEPDEEDHLSFRDAQRYIARLVGKEIWKAAPAPRFRHDATYMITGGLGGLGLTVARWMVARGARYLLLVGRKAVSEEVQRTLVELKQSGAIEVVYCQADISREGEGARLLSEIEQLMHPLRGVIHAAGVLADGTLLQQSWSRFLHVMAAKVDGAWQLHHLTKALPLDHFVLFSSSASILGAAGQGNYAAANAFMDGLAHFRQAQGLPGLSINWGPWNEVGMAAALDPRAHAQRAEQGIRLLAPVEGIRLLEQVMSASWPQVGIISIDWEKLLVGASSVLSHSSLFKDLLQVVEGVSSEIDNGPGPVIRDLMTAEPGERRGRLQSYVLELVAQVLGAEPVQIDPEEGLTSQGFDSLMALELRGRVEAELKISIPILNFFRGNSVVELTLFLFEELAKKFPDAMAGLPEDKSPEELLAGLEHLSDAEVDAALRQEMER